MSYRYLLPALLSVSILAACKQKDDTPTPTPPPPSAPQASIRMTGLEVLTVPQGQTSDQPVSVVHTGMELPSATLSISNLPQGVTGTFTPRSAVTDFTSILRLTADESSVEGAYSYAVVTATQDNGASISRSVRVTVTPRICGKDVEAVYTVTDSVGGSPIAPYQCTVVADQTFGTRIRIGNFSNTGFTAYADLDCTFKTVDIPYQVVNGRSFEGFGSFDGTTLRLNYEHLGPSPGIPGSHRATFRR